MFLFSRLSFVPKLSCSLIHVRAHTHARTHTRTDDTLFLSVHACSLEVFERVLCPDDLSVRHGGQHLEPGVHQQLPHHLRKQTRTAAAPWRNWDRGGGAWPRGQLGPDLGEEVGMRGEEILILNCGTTQVTRRRTLALEVLALKRVCVCVSLCVKWAQERPREQYPPSAPATPHPPPPTLTHTHPSLCRPSPCRPTRYPPSTHPHPTPAPPNLTHPLPTTLHPTHPDVCVDSDGPILRERRRRLRVWTGQRLLRHVLLKTPRMRRGQQSGDSLGTYLFVGYNEHKASVQLGHPSLIPSLSVSLSPSLIILDVLCLSISQSGVPVCIAHLQ